jgi:hypothetical protein
MSRTLAIKGVKSSFSERPGELVVQLTDDAVYNDSGSGGQIFPSPPVVTPPVVDDTPDEALGLLYFAASGDPRSLAAVVAKVQPKYSVYCDINPADDPRGALRMAGSGFGLPAIHYGTQDPSKYAMPYVVCLTPWHPYFSGTPVAAALEKAHEVVSDGQIRAATHAWEAGESSAHPEEVSALIGIIGPGGDVSKYMMQGYRLWWIKRHGAPPLSPASPLREVVSAAEVARIQALPDTYIDALVRGERPANYAEKP